MTLVSDIKAGVKSYTGDLQSILFTDADMLRYINAGVTEFARKTRCLRSSVTSSDATLNSTDLYGGVVLPSTFLVELDVYWGSPAARLARLPMSIFSQTEQQTTTGQPSAYVIGGYTAGSANQRVLYPYPWMTPGATGQSYRVNYVYLPPASTADSDTIPLPSTLDEALTLYAVRRCKIQEDDYQSAAMLKNEIDDTLVRFMAELSDHGDLEPFQIQDETTQAYSLWEW